MDNNYLPWGADKDDLIRIEIFTNDSPVVSHKHDYIEIEFIMRGSCIHKYHNSEVKLIPGDVFIVIPHEEHSYIINSEVTIYNCKFYQEAINQDWENLKKISGIYDMLMVEPICRLEENNQEILHLQPSEITFVESILLKMIEEQREREIGYSLVQKSYLTLLLSLLGRSWNEQFKNKSFEYIGKRELLSEALNYLESNMKDDLNIPKLASKACMSPNYFRKIFKEITGLSPIDYINKNRIKKAANYLKDKNYSVSEVSEMVGIYDTNYFSRLFRKEMGCSPIKYRKKSNLY